MRLTNQQARTILIDLYAENHNPHAPEFMVLTANRCSAIWRACEVLAEKIAREEKARESGVRKRMKPAPKGEHQQQQ